MRARGPDGAASLFILKAPPPVAAVVVAAVVVVVVGRTRPDPTRPSRRLSCRSTVSSTGLYFLGQSRYVTGSQLEPRAEPRPRHQPAPSPHTCPCWPVWPSELSPLHSQPGLLCPAHRASSLMPSLPAASPYLHFSTSPSRDVCCLDVGDCYYFTPVTDEALSSL